MGTVDPKLILEELFETVGSALRKASWGMRGDDDLGEPPAGSIVLVQGRTGTAFQHFHSDHLWHGATGRVVTWEELVKREIEQGRGAPLLVYDTTGMS